MSAETKSSNKTDGFSPLIWTDMKGMMKTLDGKKKSPSKNGSKSVYGTSSIRTKNPDLDNPDIFYIKTRDGYFEEFNPEMIRKRCQQINKGSHQLLDHSWTKGFPMQKSSEVKKVNSYGSFSPEEINVGKNSTGPSRSEQNSLLASSVSTIYGCEQISSLASSVNNIPDGDLSDKLIYGPDLNLPLSGLLKKVQDGMSNGISTEDIVTLTMNTAYASVKNEPKWDIFAGRCFMYNESKKLRNFSATDRWKMCFHGTWPYIFSDFNVRREMGKTDKTIKTHADPSLIISIVTNKDVHEGLLEKLISFQYHPFGQNYGNKSQTPDFLLNDDHDDNDSSDFSDSDDSEKSPTKTPESDKGDIILMNQLDKGDIILMNQPINNQEYDKITPQEEELLILTDSIKKQGTILVRKIYNRTRSFLNIKHHNSRLEGLYSFSDTINDRYNPKIDGPFFKQDNMNFPKSFSDLNWEYIPSTSADFYDDAFLLSSMEFGDDISTVLNYCKKSLLLSTDKGEIQLDLEESLTRINDWDVSSCKMRQPLSHILLSSKSSRPSEVHDLLVNRHNFLKKNFPGDNGLLKYNNLIKNYDHIKDNTGRVVSLHSIIDYDFFYIVEKQTDRVEAMLLSIISILHKNWSNSNSSFKSVLGRFHYCAKTASTDRYLELPHESLFRIAASSVIGKLYDELPDYLCYYDDQSLDIDLRLKTGIIRNKSPLAPRDKSKKCFIDWGRFDDDMWTYFFKKVEEMSFAYATDAVTVPTPTGKNSGSRNNQGTSCFLIHNAADSIKGIYKTLEMKEGGSRLGGGTATFFDIRAKGVVIKGINGIAAGTAPVSNLHAESTGYVTQSNNRNGATSNQTSIFNYDFLSMLLLKSTKQDLTKETSGRDVFFAAICNDFFMKKVKSNEDVALFCLAECEKMFHTDSKQFEIMYDDMVNLGYAKQIINAKTLLKMVAEASLKNGDPYCVSMDTANNLSMQIQRNEQGDLLSFADVEKLYSDYRGGKFLSSTELYELYDAYCIIRQTNLCTEVYQPTDSEKAGGKIQAKHSACNLAATNVPFCLSNNYKNYKRLNGFNLVTDYMMSEINGFIIKEKQNIKDEQYYNGVFLVVSRGLFELLLHSKEFSFKKKLSKMNKNDIVDLIMKKMEPFTSQKSFTKKNSVEKLKKFILSQETSEYAFDKILKHDFNEDSLIYYNIFVAMAIFIVNYFFMMKNFFCYVTSKKYNKKLQNIDFSMLFYSSWMAACSADSFVGYTHNIVEIMHKYQQDYRSVIVGICGLADLRIACEISYNDITDSLEFETSTMETVEFGGLMWSHFNRIFSAKTAYPRFIEGALHKKIYHHELYGKYYGVKTEDGKYKTPSVQIPYSEFIYEAMTQNYDKFTNNTLKNITVISIDDKKICIPEMKLESGLWNWSEWKNSIKIYGVKNSTIAGNMPTSNASNISGFTPSIQPIQGIYAIKDGKIAHTVEICWTAVMLLNKYGCWTNDVRSYIAKNKGSVSGCPQVPQYIQNILKTAYEIQPELLVIHDAFRGAFTCQSSSNNRYLAPEHSNTSRLMDLWLLGHSLGLITLSYYTKTKEVIDSSNLSTGSAGLSNIVVNNTKLPLQNTKKPEVVKNNIPITPPTTSMQSKINLSQPVKELSWTDIIEQSTKLIVSENTECPEGCEGCGS